MGGLRMLGSASHRACVPFHVKQGGLSKVGKTREVDSLTARHRPTVRSMSAHLLLGVFGNAKSSAVTSTAKPASGMGRLRVQTTP